MEGMGLGVGEKNKTAIVQENSHLGDVVAGWVQGWKMSVWDSQGEVEGL